MKVEVLTTVICLEVRTYQKNLRDWIPIVVGTDPVLSDLSSGCMNRRPSPWPFYHIRPVQNLNRGVQRKGGAASKLLSVDYAPMKTMRFYIPSDGECRRFPTTLLLKTVATLTGPIHEDRVATKRLFLDLCLVMIMDLWIPKDDEFLGHIKCGGQMARKINTKLIGPIFS